jgi:outer membrane protein TolC
VNLYKAQQSQKLIQENQKRALQRVKDFKAMMDNGIIAKNDYLKAELQVSNYQIAYEEAVANEEILSYQLALLLKMDENSKFQINDSEMNLLENLSNSNERKDVRALTSQIEAAKNNVKIVKGNYFPAISLMTGYIAFDLQNVVTVSNAMNFGVGVSYDVSSLFKNNKEVKVAKSKVEELEYHLASLNDKVKIEIKSAETNFTLAKNQYKVYQEAVNQAIENFRIIKDKYDNGLADTNDLLDAETQQLQAQISEAYGKANILLKYMDLQAAQGTLLPSNKN